MLIAPTDIREKLQYGIIGMFGSYLVGLFFYVSKIPERIWPKWVAWSNFTSHTVWHFAVITGIYTWWVTLMNTQRIVRAQKEDCSAWIY